MMDQTLSSATHRLGLPPPPQQGYLFSCFLPFNRMYMWARLGASRNRAFYRTLLFLFTILGPVCRAVLVNRTIDSNLGDPVTGFVPIYQPPQNFWVSQLCSECFIRPDSSKAFDGTWNSATYIPGNEDVNVTLRFTGVAVWVFFIVPNSGVHGFGLTTYTLVNITLDGKNAGVFSHKPDTRSDPSYNVTIFSKSGLANTSHELVIGTNDYYNYSYINFDWAIYTVDDGAPSSQSISTTTAPSSLASTSSSTPAPQNSSSKTGVIVGSTLGGLAVIALVLVFIVRRLRRAPPVRYKKDEGMLDIDVPTHHQPNHNRRIPVPVHGPTQSKAARLREERQRDIDERIQSAQRELDNLRLARNAGSADDSSSAAGASQPSPELASLRNDMEQLRNQVGYLHARRESDLALILSNEPLPVPPAYTQLSNNVQ
ncbi:hypothetical protein M378DRAFT_9777 [Amanita muscaria Koide BX008]|uniref:Uncharacterized protein n=1 Tax=Amanita muscaria (strain Koide BX008) TaxID=946122 RepID=A0A0C2SUP9_AMAMK|nr:hypothetical protein M378DRAFT_9777 [Amanita muscaria Koide BX008]